MLFWFFKKQLSKANPTKSLNAQLYLCGLLSLFFFSSRQGNWWGGKLFFFFNCASWSFLNSHLKVDNKLIPFKAHPFCAWRGAGRKRTHAFNSAVPGFSESGYPRLPTRHLSPSFLIRNSQLPRLPDPFERGGGGHAGHRPWWSRPPPFHPAC